MLYKFEKLKKIFDKWGFPSINRKSSFQLIKSIDFVEAYESGAISFEDDGIYYEYQGNKQRGYMFLKEYYISDYGHFPKIHLKKCQVISDFINKGNFEKRYKWSNSSVNDIIDIPTEKVYPNKVLDLCRFCKKELLDEFDSSEDFFQFQQKIHNQVMSEKLDIYGYNSNMEILSKSFRAKKNYSCYICGIQPKDKMHRRFWHTHHLDGVKTNNDESNLQCLCILCHSFKDKIHQENFSNPRIKQQLNNFINLYYVVLKEINNPFLKE